MDLNRRRIGAYRKFAGPNRSSPGENPADEETESTGAESRKGESGQAEPKRETTDAGKAESASKQELRVKPASGVKPKRNRLAAPKADKPPGKLGAARIPENALIRMTEEGSTVKGRKRVAELLMLLGKDQAAGVLRHLDPESIEKITVEIAQMGPLGRKEAASVLSEFGISVKRGSADRAGGVEVAREMLTAAFGEDSAEKLLKRVVPEAVPRAFDFLNDLEAQQIQSLVRNESVPVLSIVMANLEPSLAAQVLSTLPAQARKEVIRRIARLGKVDAEVLSRIEESFRDKIRASGKVVSSEIDGKSVLADILRHLGSDAGEQLLAELGRESPDLSEDIRDRLFTVDTLLLIEDVDLQKVLQDFPDSEIALVLKGKNEAIRGKVLKNVSERRRTFIMEEYQHLGAMPRKEVDKATREFIAVMKELESQGKIVVRRPDERYV